MGYSNIILKYSVATDMWPTTLVTIILQVVTLQTLCVWKTTVSPLNFIFGALTVLQCVISTKRMMAFP